MEIIALGPGDDDRVMAAADLFDDVPRPDTVARFLGDPGHHLLMAFDTSVAVGFISGVETTHPDKGTEMFLYELSVAETHRRQGIGRTLVERLAQLARSRGCYGMWVGTEATNAAARATYRRGGANEEESFIMLTWNFDNAR